MQPRIASSVVLALFLLACGKGDDDGGAGTDTEVGTGGDTFTTSHGTTFATTESMTFTNSSDPTSDPSVTTTMDASAGTSSEDDGPATTGTDPESTGPGSSEGDGTTTDGGSADTGTPGDACCEAQDAGGCGEAAIENCVCATDDFCCETLWDAYCTVQVVLLGCAECPNIGGDGDCCAPHGNPGCSDEALEACVCEMDYLCCTMPWDEICVETAMQECGEDCV